MWPMTGLSAVAVRACDAEDVSPLCRSEDLAWVGGIVATVILCCPAAPGVEHELAAGSAGIGGDDRDLDVERVRRAGLALADALHLRGAWNE